MKCGEIGDLAAGSPAGSLPIRGHRTFPQNVLRVSWLGWHALELLYYGNPAREERVLCP
jgi:hypothetical protein